MQCAWEKTVLDQSCDAYGSVQLSKEVLNTQNGWILWKGETQEDMEWSISINLKMLNLKKEMTKDWDIWHFEKTQNRIDILKPPK